MIGRVVSRGTAQRTAFAGGLLIAAIVLAPALTTGQVTGAATGESAQQTYPIDLLTALRLVQAQNLDVKIARERLNEAKANHAGAIAKFLPWISAGYAFRRHEGRTQAVDGSLVDVDKQSIAVGPTINAQVDIGDAIFSSLAARQAVRPDGPGHRDLLPGFQARGSLDGHRPGPGRAGRTGLGHLAEQKSWCSHTRL